VRLTNDAGYYFSFTITNISSFVPLPKSATPTRIHSNTQLYDFELTEEDMSMLDSLDRGKEGATNWYPVDAD
jgi:diketogulonate reductase-like aldo/keto reductase